MRVEGRIALRLVMEYESEEAYAAAWLTDLEFIFWARVLERDESDDEFADALAWLAEEADGCWCWNADTGDRCEFVALDRWKRSFSESRWVKKS